MTSSFINKIYLYYIIVIRRKNMKRFIMIILCLSLFIPFVVSAQTEEKEEENKETTNLITNAKSGILLDYDSGTVIFEKEADTKLSIASLTKMKNKIIILENIEQGKIKWDDIITVSENAASFGGSQIYLEPNEKMSVEDLFKGISVASANDATVAMAEAIAGSEEEFVKLMNKKVEELGLKNTHFSNCTGLDVDNHYSTARDLSVIARELLSHEKILEFSSIYEDYLREDTENKFWLVNTNKLVRQYQGADGLKTGHTDAAGYCLAATAKKNDMRLIAIVLGEENSKVRNSETMALLDYGFDLYEVNVIQKKGTKIDTLTLDKADKENVDIVLKENISIFKKKTDKDIDYTTQLQLNEIKLPVKQGDTVGKVLVKDNNNKTIATTEVTVKEDIKKIHLLGLYIRNLKEIFTSAI